MPTTATTTHDAPASPTPWLVVAALAATLAMNAAANLLPLAGRTTEEISARFPVLLTPAGFTFSIWGVIYAALTGFAIYQVLPARRRDAWLEPLRWLFVTTCAFNVAWLVAWHNLAIVASLALMAGLLATLLAIYARLARDRAPTGVLPTWLVRVPFSLYLGWITVASLVNARVVAYELGWEGGGAGERLATLLVLTAVGALALGVLAARRDAAYAAVIAWAAFGIWAANRGDDPSVAFAAAACAVAVAAGALWTVVGRVRAAR